MPWLFLFACYFVRSVRARYPSNVPVYEMMVPTANTERYSFLLETNLGAGRPTFLAGASGSGKTMLAAQVSPRCFSNVDVTDVVEFRGTEK